MSVQMSKEQGARSKNALTSPIKSFTDLNAWAEAHSLYVRVHKATKGFPKDELFGLTSQIRRAALSVSSNIAEGFGRSSDTDKVHFYIMARGSLFEVQNQLYAARDTALVDEANFEELLNNSLVAQRLLIGLINATRRRTT
jgi:four helix bundle protein